MKELWFKVTELDHYVYEATKTYYLTENAVAYPPRLALFPLLFHLTASPRTPHQWCDLPSPSHTWPSSVLAGSQSPGQTHRNQSQCQYEYKQMLLHLNDSGSLNGCHKIELQRTCYTYWKHQFTWAITRTLQPLQDSKNLFAYNISIKYVYNRKHNLIVMYSFHRSRLSYDHHIWA